ncbi:MAG: hypothetical protein HY711_07300 [Candidatus Melainabacteria bacterium]|nr:hypothetical protein [Candidatus Melainabacteria bacterium]
MKKKCIGLVVACALSCGVALPSYADGPLGNVSSLFGAVTAVIIDVPQGILVDSLYRMPLKTTKILAEKFGDEKGLQQNMAGAMLGIPAGFLWGIPYGALHGWHHGLSVGWDKPFSTESYLVTEEK